MTRLNGLFTAILFLFAGRLIGQENIQLPLDVFVNDLYRGQIHCTLESELFEIKDVSKDELLLVLENFVDPELYSALELKNSETLSIEDIRLQGIIINFDYESLAVTIEIPAELRKLTDLSIIPDYTHKNDSAIKNSNISGYANFYLSQNIASILNTDPTANYSAQANIDSNINIYNYILETDVTLSSSTGIDLPDIRLVHDYNNLRLTAGHHSPRISGFQKSESYQGILINSRNTYRSQSSQDIDFIIDEDTTAQIILNGRPVKTIQLSPGKYNLQDFPFYSGLNKVDIILSSKTQGIREFTYFLAQDGTAVPEGEIDFSLSGGITEWATDGYHASGLVTYGISNTLNIGANAQYTQSDITLGAKLLWLTPVGNINIDTAYWLDNNKLLSGSDFISAGAVNLGYRYINNENPLLPLIGLSTTYMTPDFQNNTDMQETETGFYVTQKIGKRLQFTGALNYRTFYSSEDTAKLTGDLRFSFALSPKASISGSISSELNNPSLNTTSASILFQLRDQARNSSINYNQNLMNARSRIDWQTTFPAERIDISASWEGPSTQEDFNYNIETAGRLTHDRFTTSLQMGAIDAVNGLSIQGSHSFSFALAMAEGYVSFGRPISDSFALVIPRYSLADEDIGVNYDGRNYEGISDGFGPALIGSLGSYRTQAVTLELLDPASQLFIKEDTFFLNPSYKSGTVLFAGSRPEVLLIAEFYSPAGKAISLKLGTALSTLDDTEIQFFTDENGLAYIYGLQAGEYEISIPGYAAYVLTIDDNESSEITQNIELQTVDTTSKGDAP